MPLQKYTSSQQEGFGGLRCRLVSADKMVAKCIWRGPQRSAVLRTEYRGLETSGRRLLGTSVLSGQSKVRGCDVHCTNGRAVFNLVKSARCVLMAHNCVSMCTNTGQQLEVCALCTCAACALCSIGAKNSHCKCRNLHCTVCIALNVHNGRGGGLY